MSDERDLKLRKVAVGGALVLAAPLSVASWLLAPFSMVDGAEFVSGVESLSRSQTMASLVTGALFFPLAVIGVMGLMHLLKGRESRVGTIGGGLAIFGLTLNTAALGAAGTLVEVAISDLDAAKSASLVEATMNGGTGILILFGPLLAAIGTTMLGVKLYAAHTVPHVSAALLAIYGPLQLVGFAGESVAIITVSYAVMTLALIPIGLSLIGGTVDEWSVPPSFEGFRRVRGVTTVTAE